MNISVNDNPSELRYELHVDGELAGQIRYRRQADAVVLVHTDIEPRFEGHGLGSRLVQGALDDLRARGLALVPLCPFVADFIGRHPEYADPRHYRHGAAAVMKSSLSDLRAETMARPDRGSDSQRRSGSPGK